MTSAFVGLQAGLVAALTESPALAGGNITANRLRPIPASQSAAIVVRLDRSEGQQVVIGALDWSTEYTVECYARAPGGGEPAAAIDQLLVDTWERINALDATALGATDITVNPRVDWQYDDGEAPMVCAVIGLTVLHRTIAGGMQAWT